MVQDARHDTGSPALDDVTLAFTGMAIIAGLLIGASGPIFVIFIGPGLVAGPTWGGLVLFLAIAVAGLSGLIGIVVGLFWHGARYLGRVCLISLALVGGILGGSALGRSTQVGGWAPGPTAAPGPSWSLPTAGPVSLSANAEVTLALEDVPRFTPTTPEPFGDGRFGHWCASNPGTDELQSIDTHEVGRLDDNRVRVGLDLTDPRGFFASLGVAIPRVTVTVTDDQGMVLDLWVGPGTVIEAAGSSGRLTFTGLPHDEAYFSGSLPETLSGEVTWRCGIWRTE